MEKAKINTGMVWPFLHTFAPCHFSSLVTTYEGQQGNMAPSKEVSNKSQKYKVNDGKQDRGHSQVFVAICIYLYLTLTLAFLNADVK